MNQFIIIMYVIYLLFFELWIMNYELWIMNLNEFIVFFYADCHRMVDAEQFYLDCLYDVCSCEAKLSDCLCPSVASYAKECARKHVIVDWIPQLPKCGKRNRIQSNQINPNPIWKN